MVMESRVETASRRGGKVERYIVCGKGTFEGES